MPPRGDGFRKRLLEFFSEDDEAAAAASSLPCSSSTGHGGGGFRRRLAETDPASGGIRGQSDPASGGTRGQLAIFTSHSWSDVEPRLRESRRRSLLLTEAGEDAGAGGPFTVSMKRDWGAGKLSSVKVRD